MGIVQVRNSDGVLEEEIERTTANLFSKYETDDVAKSTIDYYQQHVSELLSVSFLSFVSLYHCVWNIVKYVESKKKRVNKLST